jgi:MiaB-like tRNA modifying enzyme
MAKIYREVYGCAANTADYEIASGLLKEAGFELVESPEKSDLNLIFTCVVKIPTQQRMIHRIKKLTGLKRPLIVAGCMPKTGRKTIEKIDPNASLLCPDTVEKVIDAVNSALDGKKFVLLKDLKKPKLGFPRCRKNSVIGITQIGRGCLLNCSYCIEPYRGNLFSYSLNKIVGDVNIAVKQVCKEIWITSLDNGCYGFDSGTNLAELLKALSKIERKFWIRVGMANPLHVKKILEELIEVYQSEKIFKFLHLPIQSGSDKILRLMNRGYKVRDFIEIVEKFRKKHPKLTLATDIITGFPFETEENFKETIKLLERIKPDVVNLSKFGPMPGTQAAKMKQLPQKIVNKRSRELSEVIKKTSLGKNKEWIGWMGEVLVDEGDKNTWIGRNFAYKPIIIKSTKNIFGKFVKVKIENVSANCLIGKIIS